MVFMALLLSSRSRTFLSKFMFPPVFVVVVIFFGDYRFLGLITDVICFPLRQILAFFFISIESCCFYYL